MNDSKANQLHRTSSLEAYGPRRGALGWRFALLAGTTFVACGDGVTLTVGHIGPLISGAEGGTVTPPKPDASVEQDGGIVVCGTCAVCMPGKSTTVSGTVYDPAGLVPLYNAIVYQPRDVNLAPIDDGLTCDRCDATVVNAATPPMLTDAHGNFSLDVTPGINVPLVIQIGRWRRQVTIPSVTACQDNPLTDHDMTRLPRNQTEGHLPQIALTTGHSDALECLLRRIGISDQEFTVDSGPGRVHMFVGCDGDSGLPANQFSPALGGAKFAAATSLWADPMKLMKYDMLVMSCEGSQCESDKKPYINNIKMYADNGGRLFLDHLHFYWLRSGPDPWPDTADYVGPNQKDLPSPFTAKVDQTFPKGSQFAEWLVATQASPEAGTIQILGGQFSVRSATPPATQKWIYTDQNPRDPSGTAVEYMTMNTPTPSELPDSGPDSVACGRVVFTDLHVVVANGADGGTGLKDVSHSDTPFPNGCVSGPLTPQEKALEFMFFDLSSCVEKDSETPKAPPLR